MMRCREPGARLNIKMSYQYRNSHYKDKTVSWPSYLSNGNPIPGKNVFILRRGTGCHQSWYVVWYFGIREYCDFWFQHQKCHISWIGCSAFNLNAQCPILSTQPTTRSLISVLSVRWVVWIKVLKSNIRNGDRMLLSFITRRLDDRHPHNNGWDRYDGDRILFDVLDSYVRLTHWENPAHWQMKTCY